MSEPNEALIKSIKLEQLKLLIIENQNQTQKGYYTRQEWGLLHQSLLGIQKNALPILNAWRILKLINFGDDYVPTGLIYDTLITLLDKDKSTTQIENLLKNIFFKFIQFNGKSLSQKEREELAFFKVIRSVVQGYKQILNGNSDQIDINKKQDRNSQLYRLHNVFTYKKNLQALKKIEDQFKSCKFEPELNPRSYETQPRYLQMKQSSQKPQSNEKYNSNMVIDQSDEFNESFVPRQMPNYPQFTPKGHDEYLSRMERSRQMKRNSSFKPYHCANYDVGPFSLDQRNQQRKQNLNNNYKLLFIIKAEVGKKLYRIKVRQNMSIDDCVKNIQKMVGFKQSSLYQMVKNYFKIYQHREKKKQMLIQQEY